MLVCTIKWQPPIQSLQNMDAIPPGHAHHVIIFFRNSIGNRSFWHLMFSKSNTFLAIHTLGVVGLIDKNKKWKLGQLCDLELHITGPWTNVDLSSVRSCGIHLGAISQEITQPPITEFSLKITDVKSHSNFPGANELTFTLLRLRIFWKKYFKTMPRDPLAACFTWGTFY